MTIKEMREKRANLWEQMKALNERAKAENRDLSAEERTQWDGLDAEMTRLKAQVERDERVDAEGRELDRPVNSAIRPQVGEDGANQQASEEYRKAFWGWARNGSLEMEPEQRAALRRGSAALPAEARALGVSVGAAGGYTVANEDIRPIVDAMKMTGGVREVAYELTTDTGGEIPVPTSDDTANKGARIAENVAVSEQDVTFGQKVLHAFMYSSKMVKVPIQLLQDTSFPIESWLTEKLGVRIGRITNEEFTNGTGNAMPEGVVAGSALGKTTAAAGAITYGELRALEHSVDPAYRKNGRYMFADSTLLYIKQLLDGQNRPLYLPGINVREPDTINGYPFTVNDDMDAIAATKKTVLFGDFKNYWVRNVRGIMVLRLAERFAEYGQVAFLAFSRHDGILIDAGQHPVKHLIQHA